MQRIDFLDLTVLERQAAANIVGLVSTRLPWERVEAVFRSLARAEWLLVPQSEELQRALPMSGTTLLRNERAVATAIVLALQLFLDDEESADRVIRFLAQRGAALDALLVHGATVCLSQQQQKGRAVR